MPLTKSLEELPRRLPISPPPLRLPPNPLLSLLLSLLPLPPRRLSQPPRNPPLRLLPLAAELDLPALVPQAQAQAPAQQELAPPALAQRAPELLDLARLAAAPPARDRLEVAQAQPDLARLAAALPARDRLEPELLAQEPPELVQALVLDLVLPDLAAAPPALVLVLVPPDLDLVLVPLDLAAAPPAPALEQALDLLAPALDLLALDLLAPVLDLLAPALDRLAPVHLVLVHLVLVRLDLARPDLVLPIPLKLKDSCPFVCTLLT